MVGDPYVKCGKLLEFKLERFTFSNAEMKLINRNLFNRFSFYVSDGEEGVPNGKYMYMIIELNN